MRKTPRCDAARRKITTGHGESDWFVPLSTAEFLEIELEALREQLDSAAESDYDEARVREERNSI